MSPNLGSDKVILLTMANMYEKKLFLRSCINNNNNKVLIQRRTTFLLFSKPDIDFHKNASSELYQLYSWNIFDSLQSITYLNWPIELLLIDAT